MNTSFCPAMSHEYGDGSVQLFTLRGQEPFVPTSCETHNDTFARAQTDTALRGGTCLEALREVEARE